MKRLTFIFILALIAALALFGVVNLLVQLGTSFTNSGQEFGVVSDRYFPQLAIMTVLILNGILAYQTKVSFLKSFRRNLITLLAGSLFIIFSINAIIENSNYFFTKCTVTENCPITKFIYHEKPLTIETEGEPDPHTYPYYELHLTIDGRAEKLDARPAFMDSVQRNHLHTLRLTYREGLLGKKFLLNPI